MNKRTIKNTIILFKGYPYKDSESVMRQRVPLIPLSLISLAATLRDAGYSIRIIDQRDSVESIYLSLNRQWDKVLCVGISALTGNEISEGIEFAKRIKRNHATIPIVWGGWHVSALPDESIRCDEVDIVVRGLGQCSFLELVRRISRNEPLTGIDNILYKSEKGIVKAPISAYPLLERCSLPAFDLIDLEYYREHSLKLRYKPVINGIPITGHLYYVSSFGCPHECSYCCSNSVFGKRMYSYGTQGAVNQIRWLVEEKKFNSMSFVDANFFVNMQRVEDFCKALVASGVRFAWDAQMHIRDVIRYEQHGLWDLIKKSGCYRVSIGSESGAQDILDYIRKRVQVDDILRTAEIINAHGLIAAFNFLFCLPKVEKLSHVYESIDLARRLKEINPDFLLAISFYVPFPGTSMYDDAVGAGLSVPNTLQSWGEFNTNYAHASNSYPWKSPKMERLIYNVLTFFIPLAIPGNMYRGTLRLVREKMKSSKMRLFFWIGHRLAKMRLNHSCYRFPFEIWIFNYYRFVRGIPPYVPGGKGVA